VGNVIGSEDKKALTCLSIRKRKREREREREKRGRREREERYI
jgi:hypothetical protein